MATRSNWQVEVIAGRDERNYWADVWRQRELFFLFARRDISLRYKQTIIGIAWAVLRPALLVSVMTWVFGKFAGLSDQEPHYPLLVLSGLLPWQFFSTIVSECTNSLLGGASLVSKTSFPKILLSASPIGAALLDLLIGLGVLVGFGICYGVTPGPSWLALPIVVLFASLTALGPGLFFACMSVKYRDVRHLVPFLLQLGFFASPIAFSSTLIPDAYQNVYALNPMTGVIGAFRWAFFGGSLFEGSASTLSISFAVALLGFWVAARTFRRFERQFADVI